MNLRRWKRGDTYYKFLAIWYILTGRGVMYGLYFDLKHTLNLAPRNMNALVTCCEFDGAGPCAVTLREDGTLEWTEFAPSEPVTPLDNGASWQEEHKEKANDRT